MKTVNQAKLSTAIRQLNVAVCNLKSAEVLIDMIVEDEEDGPLGAVALADQMNQVTALLDQVTALRKRVGELCGEFED